MARPMIRSYIPTAPAFRIWRIRFWVAHPDQTHHDQTHHYPCAHRYHVEQSAVRHHRGGLSVVDVSGCAVEFFDYYQLISACKMRPIFSKLTRQLDGGLSSILLLFVLAGFPVAAPATDSLYTSPATVTTPVPQVDATNFYNAGTWNIFTTLRFTTAHTLN